MRIAWMIAAVTGAVGVLALPANPLVGATLSFPSTLQGAGDWNPVIPPEVSVNATTGVTIYKYDLVATSIGPIDVTYSTTNSSATSTPRFFAGIVNSTGVQWSGFRLEVGTDSGSGFAPIPGVVFNDVRTTSLSKAKFTNKAPVTFTATTVPWSNFTGSLGLVGNANTYIFRLDIPDATPDGYSFTIRQTPIPVPEPATAALLVISLAGASNCWPLRRVSA